MGKVYVVFESWDNEYETDFGEFFLFSDKKKAVHKFIDFCIEETVENDYRFSEEDKKKFLSNDGEVFYAYLDGYGRVTFELYNDHEDKIYIHIIEKEVEE